jgi:hypothetical protein
MVDSDIPCRAGSTVAIPPENSEILERLPAGGSQLDRAIGGAIIGDDDLEQLRREVLCPNAAKTLFDVRSSIVGRYDYRKKNG